MGNLAYFLKGMDDPAFTLPEGGTLLDNTAVLIGTEVGDPAPHSFSALTFMLAGGGGVFKPGAYDFGDKHSEVDLYSTVARALASPTSSATRSTSPTTCPGSSELTEEAHAYQVPPRARGAGPARVARRGGGHDAGVRRRLQRVQHAGVARPLGHRRRHDDLQDRGGMAPCNWGYPT